MKDLFNQISNGLGGLGGLGDKLNGALGGQQMRMPRPVRGRETPLAIW